MTTRLLEGHQHLPIRYHLPRRHAALEVVVEASAPVYAFFVDREGRDAFLRGEPFPNYGARGRQAVHHFATRGVPARGYYWLLIVNWEADTIAVHYRTRR